MLGGCRWSKCCMARTAILYGFSGTLASMWQTCLTQARQLACCHSHLQGLPTCCPISALSRCGPLLSTCSFLLVHPCHGLHAAFRVKFACRGIQDLCTRHSWFQDLCTKTFMVFGNNQTKAVLIRTHGILCMLRSVPICFCAPDRIQKACCVMLGSTEGCDEINCRRTRGGSLQTGVCDPCLQRRCITRAWTPTTSSISMTASRWAASFRILFLTRQPQQKSPELCMRLALSFIRIGYRARILSTVTVPCPWQNAATVPGAIIHNIDSLLRRWSWQRYQGSPITYMRRCQRGALRHVWVWCWNDRGCCACSATRRSSSPRPPTWKPTGAARNG